MENSDEVPALTPSYNFTVADYEVFTPSHDKGIHIEKPY